MQWWTFVNMIDNQAPTKFGMCWTAQ